MTKPTTFEQYGKNLEDDYGLDFIIGAAIYTLWPLLLFFCFLIVLFIFDKRKKTRDGR